MQIYFLYYFAKTRYENKLGKRFLFIQSFVNYSFLILNCICKCIFLSFLFHTSKLYFINCTSKFYIKIALFLITRVSATNSGLEMNGDKKLGNDLENF